MEERGIGFFYPRVIGASSSPSISDAVSSNSSCSSSVKSFSMFASSFLNEFVNLLQSIDMVIQDVFNSALE